MFVARDKNGSINVFRDKPIRGNDYWTWKEGYSKDWRPLNDGSFPELSWKDEPMEITDELYFGIYLW